MSHITSLVSVPCKESVISGIPGGPQLVLKSEASKIKKPESLTPAAWCAANCKIVKKLLSPAASGLDRPVKGYDYVEYVQRICELDEHYSWESIMRYDQAFRLKQQESGCSWEADFPHLDRLFLRLKPKVSGTKPYQTSSRAKSSESCRLFNAFEGSRCTFNPCRFKHVCDVSGCGGSHSRSRHSGQEGQQGQGQSKN